MASSPSSSGSLLPWVLAVALVLSVGVNLYCLTPGYQSARMRRAEAANRPYYFADDDDTDDDEEQDNAWATLHEKLRQARQQLAACRQLNATPDTATASVTAATPAR